MIDDLLDEPDYDEYEPSCHLCGDSGKVVAADGYHEYLGYSDVPCSCPAGFKWVGTLGPRSPPW